MKKIYIISFLFIALLGIGCNKDFDTYNDNPKQPSDVSPNFLFAGAQRQLSDVMTNSNVNNNIFRLIAQQWTQTTYVDESRYNLATRQIPQNFWNSMYVDVIKGLTDCQAKIPTQDEKFVSKAVQQNQNACADILIVYAYSVLTTTFGDIPYSQATDINNVYPIYDKQSDILPKLIARLDADIARLDASTEAFGSNDLMLKGNIDGWKKFAYSLKLRLGMLLADVDPALAKTTVADAATKSITSNSENVTFAYLGSPPNTNPIWVDLIQSNRKDFIAADTFVNLLSDLSDPRLSVYFTTDAKGSYSGGIVGRGNNYSAFSKPGSRITSQSLEFVFMDFSEVSFLLAEAAERGFISGTPADYYNAAIKASMEYWGVSGTAADKYLADKNVAYATASGDWKQKIGTQKWLALYNRGFEAWTEIRRLDTPKLKLPYKANSVFPNRYTFPTQEKNLNTTNVNNAIKAMGMTADNVGQKLYWDIN